MSERGSEEAAASMKDAVEEQEHAQATGPSPDVPDSGNGEDVEEEEEEEEKISVEVPVTAPVGEKRWPTWPGHSVFRLVVPVLKVGGIIGRKGELIKKLCEETRARIRILEGPVGSPDRIVVLIYGKEEPDAKVSPAMDATLRVFKRITGLTNGEGADGISVSSAPCSLRMLIASSQAISLIGKQGVLIKSIQESSGARVRVLSAEETPSYATSDERVVDIQGETLQVSKALEAAVGHLRKFLVDHSIIPFFERSYNTPTFEDRVVDSWVEKTHGIPHASSQTGIGGDYLKRDSLYLDREAYVDSHLSGLLTYGKESSLSGLRTTTLGRAAAALVTQVTQTMQIPLSYAEDIIGVGGANIAYIRRTSGAVLTVQESRGLPDEITVEIKGSASQVQTAQTLIQEFMSGHRERGVGSGFSNLDSGLRSYSQYITASYPPPSLSSHSISGGYGSSGYGNFRM